MDVGQINTHSKVYGYFNSPGSSPEPVNTHFETCGGFKSPSPHLVNHESNFFPARTHPSQAQQHVEYRPSYNQLKMPSGIPRGGDPVRVELRSREDLAAIAEYTPKRVSAAMCLNRSLHKPSFQRAATANARARPLGPGPRPPVGPVKARPRPGTRRAPRARRGETLPGAARGPGRPDPPSAAGAQHPPPLPPTYLGKAGDRAAGAAESSGARGVSSSRAGPSQHLPGDTIATGRRRAPPPRGSCLSSRGPPPTSSPADRPP